jgi:3-phenylpropionate/trans-cinnamate dioxygenase ferredoxin reductase component
MKDVKYLLIGGGLASYHAAKQIRRVDADGSVLLVSEESLPPYDRPPLSKEYLRGEKPTEALLYDAASALAEQNIELALQTRAESLNASDKIITLSDGETVRFEKALIATGGAPIRLSIPGSSLTGIHYLRTAEDAGAIGSEAADGKRAVVVGAGFIGLEVAASLNQRGVQVTVIEALPHIWARFADESLARFVQDYCAARGITFLTTDAAAEFRGGNRVEAVVTRSGEVIDCDFVCVGVGIRPNVGLAQEAGLDVDDGIVADDRLRTSNPDIYAAGDVVSYPDSVFGKRRRVEHWGHAEYSGQVAGRNMAGADEAYSFLSYVWSDIFDLHLEFAGDESEHDTKLLRGKLEDSSFIVIYMKKGAVTAYFAVNTEAREFSSLRRLILAHKDLTGREADLTNREFNLRGLLQA